VSRSKLLSEDLELQRIREAEQQLLKLQAECAAVPLKLAQAKKEQACTMPPLAEIADRKRRIAHDGMVSRGEVANILRDQNRSLFLLALYLAAGSSLVWWGIQLMQRP
jgi:hypothetical protein